jgi:hypothetical protein
MYLSLGSLCVTPLTRSLKTSKRSTPFRRRKTRDKNRDTNNNDMISNNNDDDKNKNQIDNNEKCTKNNKEKKKNDSTSTLTWMHRLSLSDDIESVKELALEMVHSIHPCAFLPSWYMTLEESTATTQTPLRKKDIGVSTGVQNAPSSTGTSIFEGRFWIGKHPKNGTVRLPTFLKLSDALKENKLTKSDSSDSDDDDDGYSDGDGEGDDGVSVNNDKDEEDYEENEDGELVVVVQSKDDKKGNKINKNAKKDVLITGNNDNGKGGGKEEKGGKEGEGGRKVDGTEAEVDAEADVMGEEDDDDDDDNDKESTDQRNTNTHASPRLYSFSYNKHNIPHHQRACVPPKLLRRIARLGATAFIPFVTYPKCPVQFPSPPFAWIWEYQLKNCEFIESVALQLRILEGHLKIQELPMGILDLKFQV